MKLNDNDKKPIKLINKIIIEKLVKYALKNLFFSSNFVPETDIFKETYGTIKQRGLSEA